MRLLYDERYVATNMRLGCLHLADVTQVGPGAWDLVAPCLANLILACATHSRGMQRPRPTFIHGRSQPEVAHIANVVFAAFAFVFSRQRFAVNLVPDIFEAFQD